MRKSPTTIKTTDTINIVNKRKVSNKAINLCLNHPLFLKTLSYDLSKPYMRLAIPLDAKIIESKKPTDNKPPRLIEVIPVIMLNKYSAESAGRASLNVLSIISLYVSVKGSSGTRVNKNIIPGNRANKK